VGFGFLLDVPKGLVHFQGFRNRLASSWTELAALKTAIFQEAVQKRKLERVIDGGYASAMWKIIIVELWLLT
jgi:hypothetical protein